LPPWLPSCSEGFEAYASAVLETNIVAKALMGADMIRARLEQPFDSWDQGLQQELQMLIAEGRTGQELTARAQGWLLKQGLAEA